MAENEPKGVHVNWNVITMISTVAVITVSLTAWFQNKFETFEERLDKKYATIQMMEAQNVQIYMTTISGLQNNLEEVHKLMVSQHVDPAVTEAIRERIQQLRSQRIAYMQQFVQRYND